MKTWYIPFLILISRTLLLSLTVLSVLGSCRFSSQGPTQDGASMKVEKPHTKNLSDTLQLRLSESPNHLDWNQGEVPAEIMLSIMRGLFKQNSTGRAVADLASQVTQVSPTEVIIKILPQIKWSDGKKLSAQNFVDSWKRVLDPKFASPFHKNLEFLKDFQALDEQTLKLHFNYPYPAFEQVFSYCFTFPIPFKSERMKLILPSEIIKSKVPTLGPYNLQEINNQQKWHLTANHFFTANPLSAEKIFYSHIDFWVVEDDLTAYNLYSNNKIDFLKSLPIFVKKQNPKPKDLKFFPAWISYYLGFNHQKAPSKNIKIRQLLSQAIDQHEIPVVLGGDEQAAFQWVPPDLMAATPNESQKETALVSPTASAAELEEMKGLTFHYYEKGTHRLLAEWLQQQWKKNLGIEVALQGHDNQSYWPFLSQEKPTLFLGGYTAMNEDPAGFLNEFESQNAANWTYFSEPQYDIGLKKLQNQSDPKLRKDLAEELNSLLIKHKVIEPLYFRGNMVLIKERLKNCWVNPLNFYYPAYFAE